MAVIETPAGDFTGEVAGVAFISGKGETSDPSALAYFRRHGYIVNGKGPEAAAEVADPRDLGDGITKVGTPLRDAAVDPEPGDFLAPTNAGEANPHGPDVVAPGVHATPPAPIAPGPVSSDPDEQDAKESALANEVLAQGATVGEAVADAAEVADAELDLAPVDDPAPAVTVDGLNPSDNIDDILAFVYGPDAGVEPDTWTEGWRDRAEQALELETSKGEKSRSTLIGRLESILDQS